MQEGLYSCVGTPEATEEVGYQAEAKKDQLIWGVEEW